MREVLRDLLDAAIEAVEPSGLTAAALRRDGPTPVSVIAIGKAAPAMTWGAHRALGPVRGLCVSASPMAVPSGVDLIVGEHPVPGAGSFEAGRRVLDFVEQSGSGLVLVSGGGSSLCEWPRSGIDPAYVQEAHRRLLFSGRSIGETNTVRCHLSAIKCGGLTRAANGSYPTYILSDVAGEGPEVVASGPTLPMGHAPDRAREILEAIGMDVPDTVWEAMRRHPGRPSQRPHVTIVGDGKTAARGAAARASACGLPVRVTDAWLSGDTRSALYRMISESQRGLTIAAGETSMSVSGNGRGGRNTHAALLAAVRLSGTDWVFASLATDGTDGSAGAAGAIVDGGTLSRGGAKAAASLHDFDSASYLEKSGDLVITGPTGTNVADLWLLWRP